MKNFIPLVLAVLLGLAAVLAVAKMLKTRQQTQEETVSVVAAARAVPEGELLNANAIMEKTIPHSAIPAQALYWWQKDIALGQKTMRAIAPGDYILTSDVGFSRSMSAMVGEGEWAVALNVGDGALARLVTPGDEVAVIGSFSIELERQSADLAAGAQVENKVVTLTLFPRVRVLDVGGADKSGKKGEIIVALPPQQAQVLIAAQRKAAITLALRRPNDEGALNRLDIGMVDDPTFDKLLDGLQTVQLPKIPGLLDQAGPVE